MIKGRLENLWALSGKKRKEVLVMQYMEKAEVLDDFFSSLRSAVATLTKLPKAKAGPGTMKSGLL